MSLDWTVVSGPFGSYYVIATHPEHLDRAVAALQTERRSVPQTGRWTNCGTMNGRRVGIHLRSYSEQAERLAADDPQAAADFKGTLLMLSELADGIDRCRWRLSRPSSKEMTLDLDILLGSPGSPGNK